MGRGESVSSPQGEVAADQPEADGGGYNALWGTETKPPPPACGRYSPQKGEKQKKRVARRVRFLPSWGRWQRRSR